MLYSMHLYVVSIALQQKEELVNMFVTSRNYAVYRSKLDNDEEKVTSYPYCKPSVLRTCICDRM